MGLETLLLMGGAAAITGGTVMQMRGVQESADTAVATVKYEARVYKSEESARRRMSAEEQKVMRENLHSTLKRQKTLVAKSGTTPRGSPMQVQLRTVEDMAYDIGMLAHARDIEARRFGRKAELSLVEAKYARKAGKLQKQQALFGGIGKMAMLGLQYKLQTGSGIDSKAKSVFTSPHGGPA